MINMVGVLKRFIFYTGYLFFVFFIGGVVFEFLFIPALFMIMTDSGYQFPAMERMFLLMKFVCFISPVGAVIAIVLLGRR